MAGSKNFGHLAVRIRFPDRTEEAIFPHQPADLLHVHDDSGLVQEPHVDAPRPFGVTAVSVRFQNQVKVTAVVVLMVFPYRLRFAPAVIPGPGNTGDFAQCADFQEIAVTLCGLADESEFHFWRCLDSHCFRASKSAMCIFFRNSTSCRV